MFKTTIIIEITESNAALNLFQKPASKGHSDPINLIFSSCLRSTRFMKATETVCPRLLRLGRGLCIHSAHKAFH